MKKRVLALFLTVLMIVGSLPIIPVSASSLQYDADGDGESFALGVGSATIEPGDTEVTVDVNFLENTGVWAFKFYLIYDKALSIAANSSVVKGDIFEDFNPNTDVGLKNATHEEMLADIDYEDSLANAGLKGNSDLCVTVIYSECADFYSWCSDSGRFCSVTFSIDPELAKGEYAVYAVPATGGWCLREDWDSPNADDMGYVEIYDPASVPGIITVNGGDEPEYSKPTFIVSDAEITAGTETADFTLSIEGNTGIWGIVGYISYDNGMSLEDFVNGEVFADSELALGGPMASGNEAMKDINIAKSKVVRQTFEANGISYSDILATQVYFEPVDFNDNTNNGTLVSFTLNTADLEAGTYDIGFYSIKENVFDSNGDYVEYDTVHGTLTVLSCDHSYGDGVTVNATCTENGSVTYTCSKCGNEKIEVIEALGHSYDAGKQTIAPTCTEEGMITYACANCGTTKTDSIAPLGHRFNEGEQTKAPTCSETGTWTKSCTACGASVNSEIPTIDHTKGEEKAEKLDGIEYLVTRCTVCGTVLTKVQLSSLEYDSDGDGESFALEVTDATIQKTDTEVTVDVNFAENTGVWAFKFYLVYDKALSIAANSSVVKGDIFEDFNPNTDVGVKNATHEEMLSDVDYADSLANAGIKGNSDLRVTVIYSECADFYSWCSDSGRFCSVTFSIDSAERAKGIYAVYAVPATGGWCLREDWDSPNADDMGYVEIYDPASIPGIITVESNDPTFIVSDAEITVGAATADFTLSIKNNPGIWGITGYINYDEKMSLEAFTNGEVFADSDLALGGPMAEGNDGMKDIVVGNNRVAKYVYDSIGASYDGVLATKVYFEPTNFAEKTADGTIASFSLDTSALEVGTYEIAFYFDEYGIIDSNGDSVEFDVVYGTLTVVECAHEYALGGEAFEPTCTVEGQTGYVCTKCGSPERIAPIGHDYDAVVTAPTCVEDGYITKTCKRNCGEKDAVVVEKDAAALGHDYDNGVVSVAPTCTDTGVKTFSCQRCGATYTEAVAAIGHDFDEGKTTIAPTCTAEGRFVRTCKNGCGETKVTPLSALGHDYDDGVVSVAPTCTDTGIKTFSCQRCGDTYTEEIAALGHNYVADTTVAPTCTETGYTTYTCTRCGDNYIDDYVDALGHDYAEVVTTPTCTETGYTTYTCIRCDDSYIDDYVDALGHDYESVITTPTCLAGGFTTHTCTRCPASYVDSYTDVVDHSWTITNETPIRIDYKCIWCDETWFETFTPTIKVTDATIREGDSYTEFDLIFEHNPGVYSLYGFIAYDDTASFAGYSNGTVFNYEDLIAGGPVVNSAMYDIVVINDETASAAFAEHGASAEGMLATKLYYENTAEISNNMNSGVIGSFTLNTAILDPGTYEIAFYYMAENTLDTNETPVVFEIVKGTLTVTPCDHQFESYNVVEATCTSAGYKKGVCSVCRKTITLETYEELGHALAEEILEEVTCTEDGMKHVYCTRCDYGYNEKLEKYGHDYVAVVTVPTTSSHGFTTHTCSRCNDSYVDSYVLPKYNVSAPNIEISQETSELGETVTVRVFLNNNPGINHISLTPVYNKSQLQLMNVTSSVDFGGTITFDANSIEWTSASDSDFDGAVFFLVFKVTSRTTGVFSVSVNYMPGDITNANGENVAFGVKTGSVKVYPAEMILGDLDGNGRITIADVLLIRKYLAGVIDEAELFLENADVDGNNRTTIADVLLIRKYLAGVISEFPANNK